FQVGRKRERPRRGAVVAGGRMASVGLGVFAGELRTIRQRAISSSVRPDRGWPLATSGLADRRAAVCGSVIKAAFVRSLADQHSSITSNTPTGASRPQADNASVRYRVPRPCIGRKLSCVTL